MILSSEILKISLSQLFCLAPAPEILKFDPISLKSDVWSVGVLAYVLLSGYSPFAGNTKQETFCNITQCDLTFPEELFDGVSNRARHFIQATLRTKPRYPRLRFTLSFLLLAVLHPCDSFV